MTIKNTRRDFGVTWQQRLAEARERAANPGPRLSDSEIANLRNAVETLDVSSPEDRALLWSGKDILTGIKIDETASDSPLWWDKLSCDEAELFRKLGLGFSVEDTFGGKFLVASQLNYPEHDPRAAVVRELWEVLSARFVGAASGRIEIIVEGSFESSVFRKVELDAVIANRQITAVNGLDRTLLPSNSEAAYALLRRWDVERSRRYYEFIATAADSTPLERAAALDDFREIQLWYEHDFFAHLGPARALPSLPDNVVNAVDQSKDARAWKYAPSWRALNQNP